MGGLDRHGVIASAPGEAIAKEVEAVLRDAPSPFVLGADCTLPADITWDNIRAAVTAAHAFRA
jgi:uroporphyrinogen-III decarboxylase